MVAHGPAQASLGIFKADGHKFWEWQVLEIQGASSGNTGIKLMCTTSGRYATNAYVPVAQAGCEGW